MKLATAQDLEATTPDAVARTVAGEEEMYETMSGPFFPA